METRAYPARQLEPGLALPMWRALLEQRWAQRLSAVTTLSVAYHDAAERWHGGHRAGSHRACGDRAGPRELRRLMRETVAARRALSDTEEALVRLATGSYGRCEQCGAAIPAARLVMEPEARYCDRCVRRAARAPRLAAWRV